MNCSNPYVRTPAGFRPLSVVLSEDARVSSTPFPCGRCYMCRKSKQRVWVHRMLLEKRSHARSMFITLTYNDDHYPYCGSVCKRDVQLFLKRLRKLCQPDKLRYFVCGEYGERTWRPHYHGVIYGTDDVELVEMSWRSGSQTGAQEPLGFVSCGELNIKSAYYVSKYAVKGMTYNRHKELVERGLRPEFKLSSKGRSDDIDHPGGLGIAAIKEIGENIKRMHWKPKTVRELSYKGKKMPLGRYLTEKLIQYAGLDRNDYLNELWDYQDEIFKKHNKEGECYRHNIREEKRVLRKKLMYNEKVYGKGDVL